jgi:hypothetical protein
MENILSRQQINASLAHNKVPKDKAAWIQKVIPTLAKQLLDEPIRYRTYGMYWWQIKSLLNQHDYFFGDNQEGHVEGLYLYSDPYLYLAAGMMSAIARIPAGNFDNRYVYQKEHGGRFDYVLEDRDMEMRMASKEIEKYV